MTRYEPTPGCNITLQGDGEVGKRFLSERCRDSKVVYDIDRSGAKDYFYFDVTNHNDKGVWFKASLLTDEIDEVEHTPIYHKDSRPEGNISFSVPPQTTVRIRMESDTICKGHYANERIKPKTYHSKVVPNSVGYINPNEVTRCEVYPAIKSEPSVEWEISELAFTDSEPPTLETVHSPNGPVLDQFGQLTTTEWEGKVKSETELVAQLERQATKRPEEPGNDVSKWGGRTEASFEGTGYFRTHFDGDRWILVDPDGHPFWSNGVNHVAPEAGTPYDGHENLFAWLPDEDGEFADAYDLDDSGEFDHLVSNFVRAFGSDQWKEEWVDMTADQLAELGFNTLGAWSDPDLIEATDLPYVRVIDLDFESTRQFNRFPDVFDPGFQKDIERMAAQLEKTKDDPQMIGYFVGNYPFYPTFPPGQMMLYNCSECPARDELAEFLREKYPSEDALADAWGLDVTYSDICTGEWDPTRRISEEGRADLVEFSKEMVEILFSELDEACKRVDPNHLNLGPRFTWDFREWMTPCLEHIDVFSTMMYAPDVEELDICDLIESIDIPTLIVEWHFGSIDVGTAFGGLCRTSTQMERATAYRHYIESAASKPWCIGTHYFQYYDQPALGRFDGEAFNVGLFDVCGQPYEDLVDAAKQSHSRLYDIVDGETEPFEGDFDMLPAVRGVI